MVSCNILLMKFFLLVFFGIACISTRAQRPVPPQASVQMWFDQLIGEENSGLINGRHYKQKFLSSRTNPFYGNGEGAGTVLVHGQLHSATLLYDVHRDVLVVKHIPKSGIAWFVELDKASIEEFSIAEHVFRKRNGSFYEVMFESPDFQVVARRAKAEVLVRRVSEYALADEVYLIQGERQTRVSSLTKFADLAQSKDQKKKVLEFMRDQHLKRRKLSDVNLVAMAAFVQSLADNVTVK